MDFIFQFQAGIVDALRIPDALITIFMDKDLRWLNLKCFVLNGLLFLGTVLVYNAVTSMLFYSSGGSNTPSVETSSDEAMG